MRNDEYWTNRMRILEEFLLDTGYEYVKNLERQYETAVQDIESQIARWYQRFSNNNEITIHEAKKLLTTKELDEFKWTVEEYIKHGQENAVSKEWMKQLENASARVHVSRLDSLKLQLQQQAEVLHGAQSEALNSSLKEVYERGYYHTAFELQKGIGVGWTLHRLTDSAIGKVLSRPWTLDGQTFSDRIWSNKERLVNTVNTQLTQMIMRGAAPDKAIKAISDRFRVSKSQAGRLVMTESAAFANEARKDCFKDIGVEKYVIVETLDNETCDLCGQLDGKVFPMSEYAVGVTAPPFHPWCRGTTAPYFDDLEGLGDRYARDSEGKPYTVSKDLTYQKWYDRSVKKPGTFTQNAKTPFTNEENHDIISGGVSGARNPYGKAATKHAEQYYEFIRSIDTDCTRIAKNTGLDKKTVESIKQYLFIDAHDLGDGLRRFDSDYMIAQSWQRLMDGKNILPHDMTLLRHEELESSLVSNGMSQLDAHIAASQKYNYGKEATEYYASLKKYRKE